jgi:adenylate cyclase class 2
VKLYVPYLEIVQTRLERIGGKLAAPRVYERNVRYENADSTLREKGIVLRLRQDTRARLTYKEEGAVEQGISSRYEAEVEVGDFATMETILGKLGYHRHLIYEKYRTTYTLDGAEIVLDELPYGNFIEIEGDRETIEKIISRLELTEAKRFPAGYAVLFENVCRNLDLQIHDLTFANFSGIDVPQSAFEPPPVE